MNNHENNFDIKLNDRTSSWIEKQINLGTFEDANEIIEAALSEMITKDKQTRIIPEEKMNEGIQLCKDNALGFLSCSELLVESGKSKYGIILFQFAKEEIGKLAMLMDVKNDLNELNSVSVDVFTDHSNKDRKAVDLFGKDTWLIKGGFDDKGFEIINTFKGFEKPIRTNHEVRLKYTFVNYDKGQRKWISDVDHTPETLLASIRKVRKKLNQL